MSCKCGKEHHIHDKECDECIRLRRIPHHSMVDNMERAKQVRYDKVKYKYAELLSKLDKSILEAMVEQKYKYEHPKGLDIQVIQYLKDLGYGVFDRKGSVLITFMGEN